jgi:hypothetical protein
VDGFKLNMDFCGKDKFDVAEAAGRPEGEREEVLCACSLVALSSGYGCARFCSPELSTATSAAPLLNFCCSGNCCLDCCKDRGLDCCGDCGLDCCDSGESVLDCSGFTFAIQERGAVLDLFGERVGIDDEKAGVVLPAALGSLADRLGGLRDATPRPVCCGFSTGGCAYMPKGNFPCWGTGDNERRSKAFIVASGNCGKIWQRS